MADDIKSKMEKVIDEIIKNEEVAKSMPTSSAANGGKDEIKSGSPHNEKQSDEAKKKDDEAKKAAASDDDDKDEDDKKKKEEAEKAKMKKSDDNDADNKKKKDDKDEDDKAKKSNMKKSIEELAAVLDEEELELIKAWREDAAKPAEEITKTTTAPNATEEKGETLAKSLAKVVADQIEPLTKAMKEKDDLIKGMQEKIEKMASQPAYDRRSISTLETLEKSGANNQEISKSQVLDKMLELQVAGRGVTSHHIAEFESTKNISDPVVRNMVFKELKIN